MPNTRKVQLRPSVPCQEDPPNPAPCGLDSNADALVHFAAVADSRSDALNVRSAPRCGRSSPTRLDRLHAAASVRARLPQSARSGRLRMNINRALVVHVSPLGPDSPIVYRFRVENVSALPVRDISFDFYEVLGPGDFGLDDTHMPRSMTAPQVFSIPKLAPGESASIELAKWGPISRLRPTAGERIALGRFADGSPLNGHYLKHAVRVLVED